MSTHAHGADRPRVEAVLFDYGMVLTGPPDPGAWEEMRAIFGVEEPELHATYWRHRPAYDLGVLNATRYWETVARDLGRQMGEPQLGMLLSADIALWTQPNWPMIDWAAALQDSGIRTGILSNLGDAMERGVLRACPWMGRFTHLTFTHRLGIAKPEAAVYRHAALGLGVSPAVVLFIDDRQDNVQGARDAGMQAIQYSNPAHFLGEFQQQGYADELPVPTL